jgi:hypothetical protein
MWLYIRDHYTQGRKQEKQQNKCARRKLRWRHKKSQWKKENGRISIGIHRFQKHLNHQRPKGREHGSNQVALERRPKPTGSPWKHH